MIFKICLIILFEKNKVFGKLKYNAQNFFKLFYLITLTYFEKFLKLKNILDFLILNSKKSIFNKISYTVVFQSSRHNIFVCFCLRGIPNSVIFSILPAAHQ